MGAGLITPASLACLCTSLRRTVVVNGLVGMSKGIALLTEGLAIRLKNKKTDEAQKAETVLSAVRYSSLV